MADKLTFPSIPVPKEDVKSLNETVLALKRSVEMLTGQGGGGAYSSHVFVQHDTPEALNEGDMWVSTSMVPSFSVWMGGQWVKIADVPGLPVTSFEGGINLSKFNKRLRP